MPIFTVDPADGDAVKNGASNIRALKTALNTLLGRFFSDSSGTLVANSVTAAMVTPGTNGQVFTTAAGVATWADAATALSGIVDANISASAAIAVSKLASGSANQVVAVPAAGGAPTWRSLASVSSQITISYGTTHTFTHSLGFIPSLVSWWLVAQSSPELGFLANNEVLLPVSPSASNVHLPTAWCDEAYARLFLPSDIVIKLPTLSGGVASGSTVTDIDPTKWKLRCRVLAL